MEYVKGTISHPAEAKLEFLAICRLESNFLGYEHIHWVDALLENIYTQY